jgi:hypothetical protein
MLGFEWRGGEWVSSLEASSSILGFLHASSCSKTLVKDKCFVHWRPLSANTFPRFALLEYCVHILVFTQSIAIAWPIKISLKHTKMTFKPCYLF